MEQTQNMGAVRYFQILAGESMKSNPGSGRIETTVKLLLSQEGKRW